MRAALVTGGGGGIGRAVCSALGAQGLRVAVADLDGDRAGQVASAVGGVAVTMDVADPASVASGVARTEEGIGPVDVLVNCVGWDRFVPFLDTTEDFSERVLMINLHGPIRVTRAVVGGMVERARGRVVNVASDAGRVGSSLEVVYSAAKGGLIAFSKALAREVARYEVTVNSVCPGPTDTPLLDAILEDSPDAERVLGAMTKAVPMRRRGVPGDVAPAVAFLASEAAGFITGQTLSVSGGLTMA
jgi:2-hydroxycyclohexanecarboxyl-CoA dehydrogenase